MKMVRILTLRIQREIIDIEYLSSKSTKGSSSLGFYKPNTSKLQIHDSIQVLENKVS